MLKPFRSNQFKRDVKLAEKRKKNLDKLDEIILALVSEKKLPIKNRDHNLTGEYTGRRECHIEPDWLLIYKISGDEIIFERTGSHSDLFK